jgi:cold shock CspA family protein
MPTGTVIEFDEDGGYGTVREHAADGGPGTERFFHCTAIADGSRTIEVGAAVRFDVVAGLRGVYEARRLVRSG